MSTPVEQRLCRSVIPSSYALTRRLELLQLVKTPRHFLAAANLIDQIDFLMAKRRMVKYMLKRSQEFVIGGYDCRQSLLCADRRMLRGLGYKTLYGMTAVVYR